jgi:hypothetical protein
VAAAQVNADWRGVDCVKLSLVHSPKLGRERHADHWSRREHRAVRDVDRSLRSDAPHAIQVKMFVGAKTRLVPQRWAAIGVIAKVDVRQGK